MTARIPCPLNHAFGRVLRQLRSKAGLPVAELAGVVEHPPSFVDQLEDGRQSPSLEVMEALALTLGRRPWQLVAAAEKIAYGGRRISREEVAGHVHTTAGISRALRKDVYMSPTLEIIESLAAALGARPSQLVREAEEFGDDVPGFQDRAGVPWTTRRWRWS